MSAGLSGPKAGLELGQSSTKVDLGAGFPAQGCGAAGSVLEGSWNQEGQG